METCPAFGLNMGYAPDLLAALDCKTDALARAGFGALTAAGSPAMVAIGGMMTLLVAFQGYRLILGGRLDLSDTLVTMVKIGLVLAFATQWPAYQTVFYDVAIQGPQELLARLPFDVLDDPGQYPARLQVSYDRLAALEVSPRMPSTGIASAAPVTAPPTADPYAAAALPPVLDVHYGDFFAFRPMSAGLFLLVSGLAALALPRLIAGLLLALGPVFIGFLLFNATRSIFLGWVRMLAWSVIAGTIAAAVIGIELSVVEPQISGLIADLASGVSGLPKTGELIATILLFACLLAGALIAAIAPTRIASLSLRISSTGNRDAAHPQSRDRQIALMGSPPILMEAQRSRAQLIGDRMGRAADTEERTRQLRMVGGSDRLRETSPSRSRSEVISPLGQSYRRTTSSRRLITPARRDKAK